MNIHNINTIARYEVKLLRRSWLFRIFAILALLGITFFTLSTQTHSFSSYMDIWGKTAVSSLFPFSTTYYYNIAQSVIVIFLAGSFLKRDKKLDTAEVIYVRPMSNADYIIGKTWGIMLVFVSLNIISLLITVCINLLITRSPFDIFPYVFYLLTISLPSLLFILGLSFTAMCLLKNQAVTFIVMLGFIGMVFFYLSESLYGVFDFFGVNIPGIFSDVTGHADIRLFLLQRFAYFLLGCGLISFTISLVKRLPHRPWKVIIVNTIGCVLVLAGILAGLLYVWHYKHQINLRNEYILSFNAYESAPKVNVLSDHITIEPHDRELTAESVLKVKNANSIPVDRIILYLNPGLQISSVESGGTILDFKREHQIVIISKSLAPEAELTLTLKYSGKIDENVYYTDISQEELLNTKIENALYRFGKRYAWLEDRYTLLTPEGLWYPVSIPPASPRAPYNIQKDFTNYTLTVVGTGDKTVLSQGTSTKEDGKITFTNATLLPGISLTIADYEKRGITVDSVDYELYYFKGHDFFSKHFKELNDTLPHIIREFKNDQEIAKGRKYPFRKFVMAETPVQFFSYTRNWKGYTEYVMPEIAFIPERGITIDSDFETSKFRQREDRRHGDQGELEEIDIEIRVFGELLNSTFIQEKQGWSNQSVNKLNIAAMFFGYTTFIYSDRYPIIDVAINTLQNASSSGRRSWWMGIINDQQRANLYLENKSFKAASEDAEIKPEIFYELLKLKSNALKNYIITQIPTETFNTFIQEYFTQHQFSKIEFSDFIQELDRRFNVNLTDFIDKWYLEDHSPTIYVQNVDANKIVMDEFTKYQIRFKVNNPSDVDAIITVQTEEGGGGRMAALRVNRRRAGSESTDNSRNYIIPAGQAKEIRFINDERPANVTINTNISHNLPTSRRYNFPKIDNTISDTTSGMFDIDASVFDPNPEEIIVDNEDRAFRIIESNSKHKLKDLFQQEEKEKYKNFMPWRFPSKWTAIAGDFCYGATINSAVHKSKGSGANSVVWEAEIPRDSYYELLIWNPKITFGRRRRNDDEERKQTYTLRYNDREESVTLDLGEEDEGWVSIGNFDLSKETVTVTLTDKVSGRYVIADAIKFARIKSGEE